MKKIGVLLCLVSAPLVANCGCKPSCTNGEKKAQHWHIRNRVEVTCQDEEEDGFDWDCERGAYYADVNEEWPSDQEPWWISNKEDTWTTELISPNPPPEY